MGNYQNRPSEYNRILLQYCRALEARGDVIFCNEYTASVQAGTAASATATGGDRTTPGKVIARGMMAKAGKVAAGGSKKGGGKGNAAGGGGDVEGDHGLGVTPINYLKDGKDVPIKPDEEYPDWLWNMQLPSLARLKRTKEEDYTLDEFRRFVQLDSREKIKRQNRSRRF